VRPPALAVLRLFYLLQWSLLAEAPLVFDHAELRQRRTGAEDQKAWEPKVLRDLLELLEGIMERAELALTSAVRNFGLRPPAATSAQGRTAISLPHRHLVSSADTGGATVVSVHPPLVPTWSRAEDRSATRSASSSFAFDYPLAGTRSDISSLEEQLEAVRRQAEAHLAR